MNSIIKDIRRDLKASVDEKTKNSFQRFFKESVLCYGVKTGSVGKIAKRYWEKVKGKEKSEIFALCEELYRSDYTEEAFIVSFWGMKFHTFVTSEDLAIFEHWIGAYINNWAKCDGFCNHAVGDLIVKFPEKLPELKRWARSENRWMKRASAVTLIVPAKRGIFLDEAFQISDILLMDTDDMVQKGYGWLLKEESRKHQDAVFAYVMKNKPRMPRTALRYAIELMPTELRAKAMEK
jgi:3-methyladenine DNA glycosylase AlkD